jgi:hypothetical protein
MFLFWSSVNFTWSIFCWPVTFHCKVKGLSYPSSRLEMLASGNFTELFNMGHL